MKNIPNVKKVHVEVQCFPAVVFNQTTVFFASEEHWGGSRLAYNPHRTVGFKSVSDFGFAESMSQWLYVGFAESRLHRVMSDLRSVISDLRSVLSDWHLS